MKKIFIGLLLVTIATLMYLYFNELSFSPLKNSDFKKLFNNCKNPKKLCGIDFLGINFKGELFEVYLYKTGDVYIDSSYPAFKEWEDKRIDSDAIISKWKSCPIDSQVMELYKFAFTANNLDNNNCTCSFNSEIRNSKNYYSYVYFNELEHYFLLYCSEKKQLYYLRRRGF